MALKFMRITIGIKIFAIALVLMVLIGTAAWLNLLLTRTVELVIIEKNYLPAVVAQVQAHIEKLEELSATATPAAVPSQ